MKIKQAFKQAQSMATYIDRVEYLTAETLPLNNQNKIEARSATKVHYITEGKFKSNVVVK